MARVPYVESSQASAEVQQLLTQLPPLNVFRMMAHAETSFRPLVGLGTAILAHQALAPRLRELIILRVATLSAARYEWVQHVPIAEAVGVTAAEIAALERDDVEADCFDELTRALLRFTTEVVRDVRASDAALANLVARLSLREVIEVVVTIGYYMMVARLLETAGVDIDGPAGARSLGALR